MKLRGHTRSAANSHEAQRLAQLVVVQEESLGAQQEVLPPLRELAISHSRTCKLVSFPFQAEAATMHGYQFSHARNGPIVQVRPD